MKYGVSYKHNGTENSHKWTYGGPVALKSFNSIEDAMTWINNTAGIEPIKLLQWDDDIDCFSTLKEF